MTAKYVVFRPLSGLFYARSGFKADLNKAVVYATKEGATKRADKEGSGSIVQEVHIHDGTPCLTFNLIRLKFLP